MELTGSSRGKGNKIRDIIQYDKSHIMIVDHRNHRLQIIKLNSFDPLCVIEKIGNLPLILPGNVCILNEYADGGKLIAVGTVKYQQRIEIFHIDPCFTITPLDTFILNEKDSFGPGGIVVIPDSNQPNLIKMLVTNFFSGNLISLEFNLTTKKFTKTYNEIQINNQQSNTRGSIDIAFIQNKLLVLCCNGLAGSGGESRILEYSINQCDYTLNNEITTVNGIPFDFTHSAGALTTDTNNNIYIADSGNDRIVILKLDSNSYYYKETISCIFPISVCIFNNKQLLISTFRRRGKIDIPNSDTFIIQNLNTIDNIQLNNSKDNIINVTKLKYQIIISDSKNFTHNTTIFNDLLDIHEYTKVDVVSTLMKIIFMESPIHIAKRIESTELFNLIDSISEIKSAKAALVGDSCVVGGGSLLKYLLIGPESSLITTNKYINTQLNLPLKYILKLKSNSFNPHHKVFNPRSKSYVSIWNPHEANS